MRLYEVPGSLLSAANDKFAVRTTSRNQYFEPIEATVRVLNVESGNEVLKVTSQDVLDTFPSALGDDHSISSVHYGFGWSAAVAGERILVGAPGSAWICDCAVDPAIEVRGRAGRAFVFDIAGNTRPCELDAPDLAALRREQRYGADDNWLYFGYNVAATASIGVVNGRTYDLSTGEMLVRLETGDPVFDAVAVSSSHILTSHAWGQEISIYDFSGGEIQTLTVPPTGARNGQTIALDGKLALVGVPGPRSAPRDPGSAYLFDIVTGKELMSFSAMDLGVMNHGGGDGFGSSVAIHGTRALIGAPYDSALGNQSGAAYLFDIQSGKLLEKILPTSRQYPHFFGSKVALTEEYALIEDLTFAGRDQKPMASVFLLIPEPAALKLSAITILVFLFNSLVGTCRRRKIIRT
jgi:hypothetical protein